jgi:hypothetical protein
MDTDIGVRQITCAIFTETLHIYLSCSIWGDLVYPQDRLSSHIRVWHSSGKLGLLTPRGSGKGTMQELNKTQAKDTYLIFG